jgi:hypothetical protein
MHLANQRSLIFCTIMAVHFFVTVCAYAQSDKRYSISPCPNFDTMNSNGLVLTHRLKDGVASIVIWRTANVNNILVKDFPNASYITAVCVNDFGIGIVKMYMQGEMNCRYYILDCNNPELPLRKIPSINGKNLDIQAINNKGLIVGMLEDEDRQQAVLLDVNHPDDSPVILSTPPEGNSIARGINEDGCLIGSIRKNKKLTSAIWNAKQPESPPKSIYDGSFNASVHSLNNRGIIAGTIRTPNNVVCALWDINIKPMKPIFLDKITFYGNLYLPCDYEYHLCSINKAGLVVGYARLYTTESPYVMGEEHIAVWGIDGKILVSGTELKDFAPNEKEYANWHFERIEGLDDDGRIVALCNNGQEHRYFLLTPCPGPRASDSQCGHCKTYSMGSVGGVKNRQNRLCLKVGYQQQWLIFYKSILKTPLHAVGTHWQRQVGCHRILLRFTRQAHERRILHRRDRVFLRRGRLHRQPPLPRERHHQWRDHRR